MEHYCMGLLCTLSVGESLTSCNNVTITNNWPATFNSYFKVNTRPTSCSLPYNKCRSYSVVWLPWVVVSGYWLSRG